MFPGPTTVTSFLLLFVISMLMVVSVLLFRWIQKYQRREVFLHSSLIKQKEATQQAEIKSMNKSLAFARASHDVRTCLAGITGLIELCQSEASPLSELEKNLDQMNICASKLLGILNSVLDISKVEAGKMQLEEVEFNVAEVIEESMDIFHVVAWKKGLEMIWDPCDGSVLNSLKVKGDPGRLKQILDNLLSNAIKFTSEGHVLVRAWAKRTNVEVSTCLHNYACNFPNMPRFLSCFSYGNGVSIDESNPLYSVNNDPNLTEFVFEVDDTGMGIPKDRRKSIFENYVQVKESINEQEGTGLGLGIVQSYVRLMGGEINIIDKGPSQKGTCFRFNIFLKPFETMDERAAGHGISYEGEAPTDVPNSSVSISSSQYICHNTNQCRAQAAFCKGLKHDTIHVLLFIQGEETKRVCKRWLESLGAKVCVVDKWELLDPAFENIKQKLAFSHFNIFEKSHALAAGNQVEISKVQNDDEIDIEESLRTTDGLDFLLPHGTPIHELHKKTSIKSSSMYTLILIDMSLGPIQDALLTLNKFVKTISYDQYKVIWLANSGTPTTDLRTLRSKEVPCDLILHRPLHGSRLHAILKLLQEFGETSDVISDRKTNDMLQEKDRLYVNLNGDRPLHGMKVLIVEDNVVLRRLASSMLSHLGASVELSENGKDALELVRQVFRDKSTQNVEKIETENMVATRHLPYDIILMDCEMPVMNGYEATKHIREEEKQFGIHIPIIALTAHSMVEQEFDFIQAGMDIHLMKPLKANLLLDAIHKLKKSER